MSDNEVLIVSCGEVWVRLSCEEVDVDGSGNPACGGSFEWVVFSFKL